MKFVLMAFVLLAALSASASHGVAAPHCVLSYDVVETEAAAGDTVHLADDADAEYPPDGSHCTVGTLAASGERLPVRVRRWLDGQPFPAPVLRGHRRLPDERPPNPASA